MAFASAVLFAVIAGSLGGNFFQVPDAEHYLRIARGDSAVLQPFASRQLAPLVARWTAALLHISLEHAFLAQGVLCLLILAGFVFFGVARRDTPAWLLATMVAVPFWPQLFQGLALPDLWYAALLAIFLFLLKRKQWIAAACMMLPLMLSRESTWLTLLCLLAAGWRELRWSGRVTALAATALGAFTTARLTLHSPGDTEHLPGFLYLLLKIPWNGLRLLGLNPWSNSNQELCSAPSWQVPLHLGGVTAIGVCGSFHSLGPLLAFYAFATTFGLLPLLAFFLLRRSHSKGKRSVFLRFALLYGGVSFVLAPVIGVSYPRLFGYAWPLLLVALPMLVAESGGGARVRNDRGQWFALLCVNVLLCATIFLPYKAAVLAAVLLWIAGVVLLFRRAATAVYA